MLGLDKVLRWKLSETAQRVNALLVTGAEYATVYSCRVYCDVRELNNSHRTAEISHKKYQMFYRFPHVRLFGIVNSLKKYTTTLAVVGVPSCFLLSSANLIDHDFTPTFFIVGLVVNVLLYSFGTWSNKVIGALYLSSDGMTVKISYLNFWGKRVDIYSPVDDVIPISEVREHFILPYVMIKRYSTSKNLLLPLRFGKVLDNDIFTKVFGSTTSL